MNSQMNNEKIQQLNEVLVNKMIKIFDSTSQKFFKLKIEQITSTTFINVILKISKNCKNYEKQAKKFKLWPKDDISKMSFQLIKWTIYIFNVTFVNKMIKILDSANQKSFKLKIPKSMHKILLNSDLSRCSWNIHFIIFIHFYKIAQKDDI